jgi:hypothetical protein
MRNPPLALILLLLGCEAAVTTPRTEPDAGASPHSPDVGPVGQFDAGPTGLPLLPTLRKVAAVEGDDSVAISFEPVDAARDYRVYVLPRPGEIQVAADGQITIPNALYRCAGNRESPSPMLDSGPNIQSDGIRTMVDDQKVGGFVRSLASATLGHVYIEPGEGRVPVYALGDSSPDSDNPCYFARWGASRVKRYTASATERDQLLAARSRDDGIAFYVPATAAANTRTVYTDTNSNSRFYFPEGPEAAAHAPRQAAFQVLTDATEETQPLMRAFYQNSCGRNHDELAVGLARFNRVRYQGDAQPWFGVEFSGLTGPTTLVVEALDQGCPFQGLLAPLAIPAQHGHQAFLTLAQLRAASPTGEVFINGQHDAANRPKAIARSYLRVKPRPRGAMDFLARFSPDDPPEMFTLIPCGVSNCFQTWRVKSPTWDIHFQNVDTNIFSYGAMGGEWWSVFSDWASDTNGKMRMTPTTKATLTADAYLHVTMEVDATTTGRRYPQILISDREAPVQNSLEQGKTIIVQTFKNWPHTYEVQVCNHRTWDVNNQCPSYELYKLTSEGMTFLSPQDEVGEHVAPSHKARFDVYASTRRIYLFLDGKPHACANLPTAAVPSGPVTVTWGDVLYHSGVDDVFAFHKAHLQTEMRRQFDNLGFSSAVAAPDWDTNRFPCVAEISP